MARDLPVATEWFASRRVDDQITQLWEPHVCLMLQCNIWHVRGRDRDLLVDTGLGIGSLRAAAEHLFERPLTVVLTHTHYDHLGGAAEFPEPWVHAAEAQVAADPARNFASLLGTDFPPTVRAAMAEIGYELDDLLVTAVPDPAYDPAAYRVTAAPPGRLLAEGDVVDLGDRFFEVLHLPGHSPGSIGLWDAGTGTLFSGDAVYDGPLLDELPGSNIDDYVRTMERLRMLPATVVHGGHDPSFGRAHLIELCDVYLARRAPSR